MMTCCTTGLRAEYISRAKRHSRLIETVANGGGGGVSDQLVTIPGVNISAFDEEAIVSVNEDCPVAPDFIQFQA